MKLRKKDQKGEERKNSDVHKEGYTSRKIELFNHRN